MSGFFETRCIGPYSYNVVEHWEMFHIRSPGGRKHDMFADRKTCAYLIPAVQRIISNVFPKWQHDVRLNIVNC